ncbi:MAG TPA: alpha/beta fold hydrolase [Desulfobacterales bacterium]
METIDDVAFASVNGIRIAYETFGSRRDRPLLLIMGLGSQMVQWDESFCRRLAEKKYWVIRFDNRDIGLSTHFNRMRVPDPMEIGNAWLQGQNPALPYTLLDMAKDAIGLIEALELESAHVVGESMGGMIAQLMAIHYRRHLRTLTSLMSTTGAPDLPPPTAEVLDILQRPFPTDRDRYIDAFAEALAILNGPRIPVDVALARKWALQSFERGLNPAGVARQYAAVVAAGDRTGELKKVTVPTLVIHGDADPLLPLPCGRAIAEAVPNAELKIISGMGHTLMPAVWDEVIEAIAGHAA